MCYGHAYYKKEALLRSLREIRGVFPAAIECSRPDNWLLFRQWVNKLVVFAHDQKTFG